MLGFFIVVGSEPRLFTNSSKYVHEMSLCHGLELFTYSVSLAFAQLSYYEKRPYLRILLYSIHIGAFC